MIIKMTVYKKLLNSNHIRDIMSGIKRYQVMFNRDDWRSLDVGDTITLYSDEIELKVKVMSIIESISFNDAINKYGNELLNDIDSECCKVYIQNTSDFMIYIRRMWLVVRICLFDSPSIKWNSESIICMEWSHVIHLNRMLNSIYIYYLI
jgi:ASC-1-like (ASCH) protein